MKISKKLLSNAFYLFSDFFSTRFLGFIYWMIAARILLPAEYGTISTAFNLATILSGLTLLGLPVALQKLLPEYLAKGKKEKILGLVKSSFKVVFFLIVLATTILLVFSNFFSKVFKLGFEAIFVTSLLMLALSFSSFFHSIIFGFQKMEKIFISNFSGSLTKLIVIILLLLVGFRYLGALVSIIAGFLTIALIMARSAIKLLGFKFSGTIDFKGIFLKYSLPAFFAGMSWLLFSNSQYVILTAIKNVEETGIFTLAMVLAGLISAFPTIFASAIFPIISEFSALKKTSQQINLIVIVIRYSIFISLPFALLLAIFSKDIILALSEKYLPSIPLLSILIPASIIFGIGNIFLSSLYAIGKPEINRNVVVLTTALFLVFAFPLTYLFFSFGMSLAYLFSVSFLFVLSHFYLRKFLKIHFPILSIAKCLISSFFMFVFLFFGTRFVNGVFNYFFAFLSFLAYLFILLVLKFYSKDDVLILKVLSKKFPFLHRLFFQISKLILKFQSQ